MESHVQMRLLGSSAVSGRSADIRCSAVKQIYKPPSGVSSGLVAAGRGGGVCGGFQAWIRMSCLGVLFGLPFCFLPLLLQDARGGDVQTATH